MIAELTTAATSDAALPRSPASDTALIAALHRVAAPASDAALETVVQRALALGALWGELLRRGRGWRWAVLTTHQDFATNSDVGESAASWDEEDAEDDGNVVFHLVSPDGAYAIAPLELWQYHLIDGDADPTPAEAFDAIAGGRLPASEPERYLDLTTADN